MARVQFDVTISLTQEEAYHLKTILGKMTGNMIKAYDIPEHIGESLCGIYDDLPDSVGGPIES